MIQVDENKYYTVRETIKLLIKFNRLPHTMIGRVPFINERDIFGLFAPGVEYRQKGFITRLYIAWKFLLMS